ncbi:glycosyltransferase family 39 protein [Vibrio sp. ZSDZ65]|uniref:Glycosyltransferase family 39 protein n=1 Tax=Vibrio qingdaonensis TaxID=2829491 RepID=A0A9X3CP08_9VIBR|nr:glycosyltransferase family 39 protein [Vibrio qingdaonensis]MCW8347051.1 glycosyltransferase family 39 protein [Vibrio qingdaonensis]
MLTTILSFDREGVSASEVERSHRMAGIWCFVYAVAWALVSYQLDPAVPYDAVEALNWASNGEWGSPNNPWFVGFFARVLLVSPSTEFASAFWYVGHFSVIALGMLGCYRLAYKLTDSVALAWLGLLTLNLSGVINFEAIPYNDNYLLFGSWSWLLLMFTKAVYENPKWWLPFGILAGCSAMAKYTTFAPVAMVFIVSLAVPSVRKAWKQPMFYAGIAAFIALVLPNFFWLFANNFSSLKWVSGQVSAQLSPGSWLALLSVFYPFILLAGLLGKNAFRLRSSIPEKVWLNTFVLLAPLIVIMGWFTFHKGGRLVEWLHPFFMPAPAVLVAYLSTQIHGQLRGAFKVLSVMALVIITGYASVMIFNVKNAGQDFIGIKTLSNQAKQYWDENSDSELTLVGGSELSEWLTFYIAPHPKMSNQWNNDTLPNVYNRHITADKIREQGVLLLGYAGQGCHDGAFSRFTNEWPQFAVDVQKEVIFQDSPQEPEEPICIGVVKPQ